MGRGHTRLRVRGCLVPIRKTGEALWLLYLLQGTLLCSTWLGGSRSPVMCADVAILRWGQGSLSFSPLPHVDLCFIGFFLCLKLDYNWIRSFVAFQPSNALRFGYPDTPTFYRLIPHLTPPHPRSSKQLQITKSSDKSTNKNFQYFTTYVRKFIP
jgi:hypothetical protein